MGTIHWVVFMVPGFCVFWFFSFYGQAKRYQMMYFIIKTFSPSSDTAGRKLEMKYKVEIFYLLADDIYIENGDDFMTMTIRS